MKKALAELKAGDYVRAEGVDTRGHAVVRTGHLLALPKEVTAQRNGTRTRGWRLFVGAAGTSIDQRSTWVTLFPGAGTVERAKAPEVGEWQQTPFGKIPGVRSSPDVNVLVLFGGKGGKRSKEPTQSTLARLVHNPEKHHYEVRDAATGETLLCPSWQTTIWWAVAPVEEEHDNPAPGPATEKTAVPATGRAEDATPPLSVVADSLSGRSDDRGEPVAHTQTGETVGYLRAPRDAASEWRFTPIGKVTK
ncbi:hypothetical protein [Streptomyces sp. NPDC059928]|uniref:hypothetical protein n=1 Tax=unclassified Streptomyces TaxID=2593676 RepID=UPI00364DB81E